MAKPDHERIWLQNAEDAKNQCEGRLWCEDKVWPAGDDPEEGEPTEYIRIDLHERALLDAERRGRHQGLEEATKVAETAAVRRGNAPGKTIALNLAAALRAKADETPQ